MSSHSKRRKAEVAAFRKRMELERVRSIVRATVRRAFPAGFVLGLLAGGALVHYLG